MMRTAWTRILAAVACTLCTAPVLAQSDSTRSPSIHTAPGEVLGPTAVRVRGVLFDPGSPRANVVGFCWGTEPDQDRACMAVPPDAGELNFEDEIEGLPPGQTIHVHAWAQSEAERADADSVSFSLPTEPVRSVEATDGTVPGVVEVTWAGGEGAERFEIWRNGELVDGDATSPWTDDQLEAPLTDVLVGVVTASTDDPDEVVVTWVGGDVPETTPSDYVVRAVAPHGAFVEGSDAGSRGAIAADAWEISVDGGPWRAVEETRFVDEDAPAGAITVSGVSASDGARSDAVDLTAATVSVSPGAPRSYRVRATTAFGVSPEVEATGHRAVGAPSIEWQRADADENARFGAIALNADAGEDATAPSNGDTRWYRVRVSADGAETVVSAADPGHRASCGDGRVEASESCDDGNNDLEPCAYGETSCTVCAPDCTESNGVTSYCGDGRQDVANGEFCDDGNTTTEACDYGDRSCEVCDAACRVMPGATSWCSDGRVDTANGEACDDGNASLEACAYGEMSCEVCDPRCALVAGATSYCGDGTPDWRNGEGCDDGNAITDYCDYGDRSCEVCGEGCFETPGLTTWCGDGTTDRSNGEDCDDGNTETETCVYGQRSCTVCDEGCLEVAGATSYCGDGHVDRDAGEACDGTDFGGDSCVTLGFAGGPLSCTDACTIDVAMCHECSEDADCSEGVCSNGRCAPDGFAYIAHGSFVMGTGEDDAIRDPDEAERRVTVTRSFWMSATEITVAEWEQVMGSRPSFFGATDDAPVEQVSFYDVVHYANERSRRDGYRPCYTLDNCRGEAGSGCVDGSPCVGDYQCDVTFAGPSCEGYRLPTEAEWEFAARAGTTTAWFCGDEPECMDGHARFDITAEHAGTEPVGSREPNPWGLHDMGGNVAEWVWDWYRAAVPTETVDPVGVSTGERRVIRGGSWANRDHHLRSADRYWNTPERRTYEVGFRLVRTLTESDYPARRSDAAGADEGVSDR